MTKGFIAAGIAAAVFSFPVQSAEPERSIKLTCDGSLIVFQGRSDGIAAKRIYVEISENYVKILGVPVFANGPNGSLYRITRRNEQMIGFKNPEIPSLSGSVNRSNGEINLLEQAAGSTNFTTWFKATCVRYRPMF